MWCHLVQQPFKSTCCRKLHFLPARVTSFQKRYITESKQKEWVHIGLNHLSPGVARISSIVMAKAQGSYVWDMDGTKYLDFSCGIAVTNTGHCHPKIVKAAQEQVAKLIHGQITVGFHEPMLILTKKLLTVVPSKLDRFIFSNSGAEAIENAVKLARHATKKPNVIVFSGSFHGRTLGTLSLTHSKTVYKEGFGPLMSGVVVTPFPYCFRCNVKRAVGNSDPTWCCGKYEHELEMLLKQQSSPKDTAAILVEPVQGEGGYIPPPKDFLPDLRRFCDKHNILLIFDEVQTGFGRTGKFFALEHYNVVPDILVIAKGLASGFPLSVVATRTDLAQSQPPGSVGGTFSGNAVCCAVASATIDVIKEENLLENTKRRGEELMMGLRQLAKENPHFHIADVRGIGLMVAVEFDLVPPGTASKVVSHCVNQGLLILTTGPLETVRIIPPLTVSQQEIQQGLKLFQAALQEVFPK
jgi:4-aminobutyrate aminotransferase